MKYLENEYGVEKLCLLNYFIACKKNDQSFIKRYNAYQADLKKRIEEESQNGIVYTQTDEFDNYEIIEFPNETINLL